MRGIALRGAVVTTVTALVLASSCGDPAGPASAAPGPLTGRIVFAFDSTVTPNIDVTMGVSSVLPDGSDRTRAMEVPGGGLINLLLVSPGGRRIAVRRAKRVYTLSPGVVGPLLVDPLDEAVPETWAPGGRRLLWLRAPPLNEQAVFTTLADGSDLRSIALPEYDVMRQVRYVVDSRRTRISYEAQATATRDVFVAETSGAGPVALTSTSTNQFPQPSPDGRRIAFITEAGNTPDGGRIVGVSVVGVDGGAVTPLLGIDEMAPEGTQLALASRWAPDGSRLAVYAEGSRNGVWVVDADGGNPRLLHVDEGRIAGMAWSPESDRLVISRRQGPGRSAYDLEVIDVTSGSIVNITRTPGVSEFFPVWVW